MFDGSLFNLFFSELNFFENNFWCNWISFPNFSDSAFCLSSTNFCIFSWIEKRSDSLVLMSNAKQKSLSVVVKMSGLPSLKKTVSGIKT